jgi:TPR repeat protein
MALRSCRECGVQVSTAAKACPCCGIDSPGAKVLGEWAQAILISLVLFITLVAGVVFVGRQRPGGVPTITGAMTDEPSLAIRGDLLRKSAVQTGQEISITMEKGETLGAILRDLGATPEEIKSIAAVLGPRGRDGNLKEGQKIRVLVSPVRGPNGEPLLTTHRRQPVRVTLVGETAIEAVAALTDLGKYVAVDFQSLETQVADADDAPAEDEKYAELVRRDRPAAEQGDAKAQHNIGVLYANGWGVPQDYAEAMRWYRKAAAQGDSRSQNNVGALYRNGRGVPQNYTEAMRWFRMAADRGESVAQYNIGVLYINGLGVPRSRDEALKWFREAAAQGHDKAGERVAELGEPASPVEEVPSPKSPAQTVKRENSVAPTQVQPETLNRPSDKPQITQDEATSFLLYCVTPAAQYGQYSSYDGGKSAGEILEKKCTKDYLQFIRACSQGREEAKSGCLLAALGVAQMTLKSFGK